MATISIRCACGHAADIPGSATAWRCPSCRVVWSWTKCPQCSQTIRYNTKWTTVTHGFCGAKFPAPGAAARLERRGRLAGVAVVAALLLGGWWYFAAQGDPQPPHTTFSVSVSSFVPEDANHVLVRVEATNTGSVAARVSCMVTAMDAAGPADSFGGGDFTSNVVLQPGQRIAQLVRVGTSVDASLIDNVLVGDCQPGS